MERGSATTCLRSRTGYGDRPSRMSASSAMEYGMLPGRRIYLGNITWTEGGEEMGIDSAVAERVIGNLLYLNTQGRKPIRILMNSNGGNVTDGFAIYDAIRSSQAPVDIEVFGSASSMGALILQAGRRRLIHPNTLILVHEGNMGSGSSSPRQHEAWAEWSRQDRTRMYEILGKRTHRGKRYWDATCARKHDALFDAERALEVGLADAIISPARWAQRIDESSTKKR